MYVIVFQHLVNAMTKYYLEWIIEFRKVYPGIEFFGQDDKAKIPVGDSIHVGTGVRPGNLKVLAPVNESNPSSAGDHDFHIGSIIPSVTLRCHIPEKIGGSFFVGDEETGTGQIFVTLRDAVFDPSNVFDHCAQLIDIIKKQGWKPTVLVLQTDGGPDHSLKRVAVEFALIAMFKELDLDHLVILRGAPNGSARNKIERCMSILNIAAAHTSLKRGQMAKWAERKLSTCNSMAAVRTEAAKVDELRSKAVIKVREIEEKIAEAEAAPVVQGPVNASGE